MSVEVRLILIPPTFLWLFADALSWHVAVFKRFGAEVSSDLCPDPGRSPFRNIAPACRKQFVKAVGRSRGLVGVRVIAPCSTSYVEVRRQEGVGVF